MTLIASLSTILLNALVIIAIKQRKELQNLPHILLSSLAVTDLLVGLTVMPLSITVDVFIFLRLSFEHVCSLLLASRCFGPFLFSATLHHLTIIAWERYVAIQKWMNYKIIVTKRRLKNLATAAWLSALLPSVPDFLMLVLGVDSRFLAAWLTVWSFVWTACVILIAYFYRKVYLGIRNLKTNEISQVNALMKLKRESKVAVTTGLLTAVLILSFLPITVVAFLGNVFLVFNTNVAFRFTWAATQLNSLLNPLLYWYRDRRFRIAILKLVGMKSPPQKFQPAVDAARFITRKDPAELNNIDNKPTMLVPQS
ncbi:adenosine receptor A3-like [Orbicella faveolata]|nr:adenosine receptor A3-like [Orbicella faveolata]